MYATFGQELYVRETARAAEMVAEAESDSGLAAQVANGLPHPSAHTRARVASKLLQRLSNGVCCSERREAFVRLVAGTHDSAARRELVYYAVSRADAIVGAIAREALYPFFIDGKRPRAITETEFAIRNTHLLFTLEPVLTLPFLAWYAEKRWDFLSARTVALAMRIIRQAGIVLAGHIDQENRRMLAYMLAPHGITLPAFVWCIYDEFAEESPGPTADRIERSQFSRTFVIPPIVVGARLKEAERQGFVKGRTVSGVRRLLFPLGIEDLTAALLASELEGAGA